MGVPAPRVTLTTSAALIADVDAARTAADEMNGGEPR